MKNLKVWQLALGLVLIVGGTVLFILAVSGVFNSPRAKISEEYICGEGCDGGYTEITPEEYEKLIEEKKSFVIFIDQGGCTTADRLEGYVSDWSKEKGLKVFKIMFDKMKKTSLFESVKFYPSVAVISEGNPIGWLRADEDADSDAYNNYEAYKTWVLKYLK